ncbi:MAG: tetratricopeptide repeat protein [Myxococcales bacterium]|nr:tetratricopeptide repeat protein [Myxococcales bacterium]MCB9733111.1 tetratricopeptide repeat protein [Deltaproteobacteria bacterium]
MAKRKRRMSKEELEAPDQFEVALQKVWEGLVKYRKPIIGGIVALVVLGVVLWIVNATSKSSARTRSLALRDGAAALSAEVGPADSPEVQLPGPKPLRFEDESQRLAAVEKGLSGYVAEYGSDDSRELVDLTLADVKLAKGDAAGALADVEAWIGKHGDSAVMPVALELKARALSVTDKAKAVEAWNALAAASTGELKADALRQAGDLQNPVLVDGGDAAKAKAAYEAALAALGPAPEKVDPFGSTGIRGDIDNRLKLLPN